MDSRRRPAQRALLACGVVATLLLAAPLLRAAHAGGPPAPPDSHGLRLPATFTGDLPCARDEIGTWRFEKERKALVLGPRRRDSPFSLFIETIS